MFETLKTIFRFGNICLILIITIVFGIIGAIGGDLSIIPSVALIGTVFGIAMALETADEDREFGIGYYFKYDDSVNELNRKKVNVFLRKFYSILTGLILCIIILKLLDHSVLEDLKGWIVALILSFLMRINSAKKLLEVERAKKLKIYLQEEEEERIKEIEEAYAYLDRKEKEREEKKKREEGNDKS